METFKIKDDKRLWPSALKSQFIEAGSQQCIISMVTMTSIENKLPCGLYSVDCNCSQQRTKDLKNQIISVVNKKTSIGTLANA